MSTLIPQRWEDVTTEWMTSVLAATCPGARVEAVDLLLVDNGTNRRARFAVRYESGSGPDVVFMKAEGDHRAVHARNGNMLNEPDLLASGAALPVDHPRPYRVIIDRDGLDYVIVMEDVTARGCEPRDATRPMTTAQVANGLRGLARLHSRYWQLSAESHPELAWVQTWAATEGYLDPLRRRMPSALERAAGHMPEQVFAIGGDALVEFAGRFIASLAQAPLTLLHGDPHIGNTYVLPNDDIGFLDWQVLRRGNWSHDVGYFLVSALTVADRREHESQLLDLYLEALGRPSRQEAWLRYRATAAYGLAVWLATLANDQAQTRQVCLALCERYATAFVDHDTPAALDDLGV
jgi:aminoglycoside phosphotransferase (APT) family kinase protein